jgi:hypothetical protein
MYGYLNLYSVAPCWLQWSWLQVDTECAAPSHTPAEQNNHPGGAGVLLFWSIPFESWGFAGLMPCISLQNLLPLKLVLQRPKIRTRSYLHGANLRTSVAIHLRSRTRFVCERLESFRRSYSNPNMKHALHLLPGLEVVQV